MHTVRQNQIRDIALAGIVKRVSRFLIRVCFFFFTRYARRTVRDDDVAGFLQIFGWRGMMTTIFYINKVIQRNEESKSIHSTNRHLIHANPRQTQERRES